MSFASIKPFKTLRVLSRKWNYTIKDLLYKLVLEPFKVCVYWMSYRRLKDGDCIIMTNTNNKIIKELGRSHFNQNSYYWKAVIIVIEWLVIIENFVITSFILVTYYMKWKICQHFLLHLQAICCWMEYWNVLHCYLKQAFDIMR